MSLLQNICPFVLLAMCASAGESTQMVPDADNYAKTFSDRYLDNGDGTVTDKKTGLQWQRCSYGQVWQGSACQGEAKKISLFQFMDKEVSLIPNADQGWRVPYSSELKSILYCRFGVTVDDDARSRRGSVWLLLSDRKCDGVHYDNIVPTIHPLAFPSMPSPDKSWNTLVYCARDRDEDNPVRDHAYDFMHGMDASVEAGISDCYLRFVRDPKESQQGVGVK